MSEENDQKILQAIHYLTTVVLELRKDTQVLRRKTIEATVKNKRVNELLRANGKLREQIRTLRIIHKGTDTSETFAHATRKNERMNQRS